MRTPPKLPSIEEVNKSLASTVVLVDHKLKRGSLVVANPFYRNRYTFQNYNGMIGQVVCTYTYHGSTISWVHWFDSTVPEEMLAPFAVATLHRIENHGGVIRCNLLSEELIIYGSGDNESSLGLLNNEEAF